MFKKKWLILKSIRLESRREYWRGLYISSKNKLSSFLFLAGVSKRNNPMRLNFYVKRNVWIRCVNSKKTNMKSINKLVLIKFIKNDWMFICKNLARDYQWNGHVVARLPETNNGRLSRSTTFGWGGYINFWIHWNCYLLKS